MGRDVKVWAKVVGDLVFLRLEAPGLRRGVAVVRLSEFSEDLARAIVDRYLSSGQCVRADRRVRDVIARAVPSASVVVAEDSNLCVVYVPSEERGYREFVEAEARRLLRQLMDLVLELPKDKRVAVRSKLLEVLNILSE